jgi:molybdenum cofactor cytidylyltransferase
MNHEDIKRTHHKLISITGSYSKSVITSLILAGGESKRMGFPKLTLEYQGQTLLTYAIHKAKTVTDEVFVIVGAYSDLYRPIAERASATVLENPDWAEGLASSLRVGVAALNNTVDAALILLPDQPFVSEQHLQTLVTTWQDTKVSLVFSRYQGILGAPCVIAKSCFASVATLRGDKGARALVNANTTTAEVVLEEFVDIDTPEEVRAFLNKTP